VKKGIDINYKLPCLLKSQLFLAMHFCVLFSSQALQSAQILESNKCDIPEKFKKHVLDVFAHHGFTNVSLQCTDIEDGSTTPSF